MISVCMATYNGERHIREQVSSILPQLGSQDELIVSDDGSTDDTLEIIRSFSDPRIKVFFNNLRKGIVGNFENALSQAEGEILFLADQDDVWMPGKLEILSAKIQHLEATYSNNTPLMLHSDAMVVDEELRVISGSLWSHQGTNPHNPDSFGTLLLQSGVTGCTAVINRALLRRAVPIPEQAMMHDWWFALVAVAFGRLEWIPDPLILYRQHDGNDTGAKKMGLCIIFKLFWDLYVRRQANVVKEREHVVQGVRWQARAFLDRYQEELSSLQSDTVSAFLELPNKSYFVRKYLTIKFGLHYHGFLRNVGNLLIK